jgi:hypothetical protein
VAALAPSRSCWSAIGTFALWSTFDQFPEEFPNLCAAYIQGSTSERRDPVDAAFPAFAPLVARHQVALAFESMKYRVHRAGTDLVSVVLQLLDDRQAENGAFVGMMEHVKADHAAEEILVGHGSLCRVLVGQ